MDWEPPRRAHVGVCENISERILSPNKWPNLPKVSTLEKTVGKGWNWGMESWVEEMGYCGRASRSWILPWPLPVQLVSRFLSAPPWPSAIMDWAFQNWAEQAFAPSGCQGQVFGHSGRRETNTDTDSIHQGSSQHCSKNGLIRQTTDWREGRHGRAGSRPTGLSDGEAATLQMLSKLITNSWRDRRDYCTLLNEEAGLLYR